MRIPNRAVWTIVVVAVLTGSVLLVLGVLGRDLVDIILALGAFSLAGLVLLGYQPWLRTHG